MQKNLLFNSNMQITLKRYNRCMRILNKIFGMIKKFSINLWNFVLYNYHYFSWITIYLFYLFFHEPINNGSSFYHLEEICIYSTSDKQEAIFSKLLVKKIQILYTWILCVSLLGNCHRYDG